MKAERKRQTPLGMMMGQSVFSRPKASHRAKPTTVSAYIGAEILLVSRVLMIFQACGVKLVMEHMAARYPTIVTVSIDVKLNLKSISGTTRLRAIRPCQIRNADEAVLADESKGGIRALRLRHTGNLVIAGVVGRGLAVIVYDHATL